MGRSVARYQSIITRVPLMVTGILVMAVLAVGSLALLGQQRQLHQALATKAATLVQFLAQVTPLGILSLNFVQMNNNVKKVVLTDDEAMYAIIQNERGMPLVSFFKENGPALTGEAHKRVENRDPLGAAQALKGSGRILEVSAPITSGERIIGSATLGFSTEKMRNALLVQVALIGAMLAAIMGLSTVLLRMVLGRILHPVQALTSAATQISSGDLDVVLTGTERADELGVLSRAFESMAGQLRGLISGLKQREDDLRRLTLFQRTLLDNAAYGIISSDPEGMVSSLNPAAERLLGYSAGEVVGKLAPTAWHDPEEIRRRALQLSEELGETIPPGFEVFAARPLRGLPEEREWTFIRKDGNRVPVLLSVTSLRNEDGRITGFVGLAYDFTERKRAELAIRESEERYRLVFENSPVSLWEEDFTGVKELLDELRSRGVADLEAHLAGHPELLTQCAGLVRIVDVNQAALSLHGASSKDELMAGLVNTFTPESFLTFQKELLCLWNGRTEMAQDATVRTLAGEPRNVTVFFSVSPNSERSLNKVIVSLTDITEHKKLEASLLQSQKMEAIGQLAGGVAHDFNNILTAIIGFASLARMKMGPEDPQRPMVDQILDAANRAAHLTHGLLAFSRKQVILPKPIDLNAIVGSIERLLRRLIGEDIELRVRLAENPLIVMADPGQIEQMLMNLATNARDAMPEGGDLVLTTEAKSWREESPAEHVQGGPGRYALITVSDNGRGMDEATRSRIFEPFFTTKEMGRGTGLGLSIAYGIVKQHEGAINVYSELGRGTTFKIYLPLLALEAEQPAEAPETVPTGGTETILLAEDDPAVRALTSKVLSEFGYRVLECVDGEDALAKFMEHRNEVGLLILDVIMPRRSGKEVHDQVKAIDPEAKIIFVSGYTADFIQRKGMAEGSLNLMTKPVAPFDLLRRVRETLDGS